MLYSSAARIKDVGPDRACAEWLLRCGAVVKWHGKGNFIRDEIIIFQSFALLPIRPLISIILLLFRKGNQRLQLAARWKLSNSENRISRRHRFSNNGSWLYTF